jgi:hypothetical protein
MNKRQNGGSPYQGPPDQGNVISVLARARPARLNADAEVIASWPTPGQIIEAVDLAGEGPECLLIHRRRRGLSGWRPGLSRLLGPGKLLGAMTSAAVTAVVIVVAVVVGAIVLRAPHRQSHLVPPPSSSASPSLSTQSPSSSPPPVQFSSRPPVFHRLPLDSGWHGRVSYAISNGVVYLEGIAAMSRPGSQSGPIATLPSSARPAGQLDLVVTANVGAGSIEIDPDGQIAVVRQSANVTWVSLDGVAFPVGSG